MGTTADKLSYLNTTKTQIKESINLTNINITNEPFRYYAYAIKKGIINVLNDPKEIWNNFEKVTGEGTFIELTSTENAPIEIKLKGNTNQAGEPTPSTPVDIHIVSGDNDIKVGQNIWNYNGTNYEQGFYDNIGSFTSRSDYRCFTYDCKQGDLFERTGAGFAGIATFWNNSTFISSQNFDLVTPKGIVQVPQNANKIKIAGTNTSSSSWIRKNPINYQVNLGEYELCKIGDYQDEFFKNTIDSEYYDSTLELDKWYLKKKIKKVVYTGANSENWYGNGQNDNYGQFYISTTDKEYGQLLLLSNYFIVGTSANGNYIRGGTSNSNIYITIAKSIVSYNITSFKEWLSTHNTIVYYVLATPTNTEITDSTLIYQLEKTLYSYSGQTNISQINNDLPFILDVKALKLIE